MPKHSKERSLKGALDRHKGRNVNLEKQRKSEKDAAKRKEPKILQQLDDEGLGEVGGVALDGEAAGVSDEALHRESVDEEDLEDSELESELEDDDDLDEDQANTLDLARLNDSDSDSDSEDEGDAAPQPAKTPKINGTTSKPSLADQLAGLAPSADTIQANEQEGSDSDDASSIALSDISAPSDAEDIVPHQRLTINNTTALKKALNSISLPYADLAFSEHQSITSPEATKIDDVNDDLTRELAFYAQSLAAVNTARDLLKKEGAPFTRPADYFAEMVKSDEHMSKIKSKLTEDAASKKASSEAKRQRELKKFGKKVQEERLKERAKEKRDMLEKVKVLKRKRGSSGAGAGGEGEGEGLFDVALEDAGETERREKRERREKKKRVGTGREQRPGQGRGDGTPSAKRQKKDEKFGFGGKKRGAKRPDAQSSGDMSGFSTKRMKGQTSAKGAKKRPGKDRRSKMR